jgi:hypothetical protein
MNFPTSYHITRIAVELAKTKDKNNWQLAKELFIMAKQTIEMEELCKTKREATLLSQQERQELLLHRQLISEAKACLPRSRK